ncbi:uncharacterized protein EDB91DRAFT_417587 [Suillus paluster]|uniref:uncharacterized protein n=1 Tax=Suillus paluster TaxID=48578 RepID=UPI001B8743D7|nr:uncharacterized protein EDB91DRAFT_417587 [Suillus paluster]KAG1753793.1 hypothetical protein EDB91DRAFT_417587 [Suillus paluster]
MMIAAPHSLGTTGMMDPLAHSRSTRFHFVGHAYLVQETAALPHDVTACSTQTELQKLGLFTFAADSSLKVAHGNFVSASCGSAASYSLGHCLSDMTNKSQPSRAKPHTRGFAKDVALRNSVPMVPPGLGHVIPPSVARPGYVSQTASSGVSEGRSGTQGLFSQCGSDGVATVVTASSAVSERSGSGAIPWVVAPQTPDRNGIATAFSSLSAHFMYSLAIKARADEVFPDPQFDGRNYVTSIVGTRIRFILESVSNPQVVVIHALWYISKITTKDMGHGSDFLGVSIFNHLYCCGVATLDELLFSAFVIVARLADKWVNDCCLASKTWEKTTAIPSSTLTNVEKTALMSLDYVVNIPRSALHGWILGLRAPSSGLAGDNSAIILRILDDVLAINEATEVNTTFMRYRGRKKKTAATPHQELPVIHVPTPVKPLTCLPDPSDWCPQADPVVNKNSRMSDWCPEADPIVKRNPRTMGIAPGSHNFVHELRQPTTALDLLELITQGTWGAAVGGPLSTIGAHFAHTVGRYGPCQTILG